MTTNVIHSIGATNTPTTMDYSSLALWAAACPSDLTSVDEVWEGAVYNQGVLGTSGSTLTINVTTDATRFVRLRAASAAETGGVSASFAVSGNRLQFDTHQGAAIQDSVGYASYLIRVLCDFETYGLQWRNSAGNSGPILFLSGQHLCKVHESLFSCPTSTRTADVLHAGDSGSPASTVTNSTFILESGSSALALIGGNVGPTITNCTIYSCTASSGAGLSFSYSPATIWNTAIFGFATCVNPNGRVVNGGYNATDQSTFVIGSGGTNNTSNNVSGVTASAAFGSTGSPYFGGDGSGLDLRLTSGSALRDAGSNTYAPAIDIFGTSRPQGSASDIGAYEYPVSSGAYTASLSDSATSSDAVSRTGQSASGIITDTAATSTTLSATLSASAAITDSATTSDARSATLSAAATLTDSAGTSDTATATATFAPVSLSDTAVASDSLSPLAAMLAMLADSAITADGVAATGQTASAALADTTTTSDALSGLAALFAALADTVVSSDAQSGTMAAAWALSDSATSADGFTQPGGFSAVLSDTAISADALSGSLAAALALSDTAAGTDALSAVGAFTVNLGDTASSGDTLSGAAALAFVLGDTIASSDAVFIPGGNYFASLSDTVASSDALGATAGFFWPLNDLVASSDALTSTASFVWSLGDVAATSDVCFVGAGLTPASQRTSTITASARFGTIATNSRLGSLS